MPKKILTSELLVGGAERWHVAADERDQGLLWCIVVVVVLMVGNSVAEEDTGEGQEVEPKGCIDGLQSSVEDPTALVAAASRFPVHVNELRFTLEWLRPSLTKLVPWDVEAGRVRCSDLPPKQIVYTYCLAAFLDQEFIICFAVNKHTQR